MSKDIIYELSVFYRTRGNVPILIPHDSILYVLSGVKGEAILALKTDEVITLSDLSYAEFSGIFVRNSEVL